MTAITIEHIEQLLSEATVDCYDEIEEFMGVTISLAEQLNFPLIAELFGERIEVVGIDEDRSSLRRGVVAKIMKEGRPGTVGLADLTFLTPDPHSAEWLAAYRYWAGDDA